MLKRFSVGIAVIALLASVVPIGLAHGASSDAAKSVAPAPRTTDRPAQSPGVCPFAQGKKLSPADAKRLQELRTKLATERDRYRELRRNNAPVRDVDAQWQRLAKVRSQIREITGVTCPWGGRHRLGNAGGAPGSGFGRCGQGMLRGPAGHGGPMHGMRGGPMHGQGWNGRGHMGGNSPRAS